LCLFSSEANAFSDDQIALLESLRREVQPALYQVIKRVVDLNLANDGECELYSRSKFDQIVRRAIDQSGKLSVEAGLLLVGVDVPRFAYDDARQGEINAQVLQIIKDSIRDQDKICNLELVGLGKFAILLPGTAHESILQVAERLNLKVRKSKFGTAAIGEVTVSIGVATFPLHADNAPALFQAGEQALLVARYQGGDRIFEPHTLQVKSSNPDIWEELVERARKAVAIEPMAQEQKQNSLLPDFASWLTKDPVLVESETAEK
jgi:diguanylate cyclase (GGDEF)-like protein